MTNPYDYFRHNPSRFPVLMPDNPGTVGAAPGTVGANPASVAGVPVPAECWASNEFMAEYATNPGYAKESAQDFANGALNEDMAWVADQCAGMTQAQCEQSLLAVWTQDDINDFCSGTGIRSCDTASVVMEVQKALKALGYNIAVDGAWGKQSQDALNASGKTFQQLATSQCEPPVPHYTAGAGGGGTQVTPPPPGPGTGVTPVGNKDKKDEGMNPWWWLAIGGAAAVGVGLIVNANKAKENPAKFISASNTKAAERKVRSAAAAKFGRGKADVFFEHGSWFARVDDKRRGTEATYSAQDYRPGIDGTGIDFELLDSTDY